MRATTAAVPCLLLSLTLPAQAFDFEALPQGVYAAPLVFTNGNQTLTVRPEGNANAWLLMDDVSAPPVLGHVSCCANQFPSHTSFRYVPVRFSFAHPVDAISITCGDNGGDDDSPVELFAYDANDVLLGTVTAAYPFGFGTGVTLSGSFGTASYFVLKSGVNGAPNPFGNSVYFEVTASTITTTNVPPVLAPIADRTVATGNTVAFAASATDANWPAQGLTFTLGPGAPSGASITPAGNFTWTPAQGQGRQQHPIAVTVTDNGTPPLSATRTFQVTVTTPATLAADVTNLSLGAGGTQHYTLTTSPAYAGCLYLLAGSVTGTAPGLPLGRGTLPLNPDFFFGFSVQQANQPPYTSSIGGLDGSGGAIASFSLPPGLSPTFAGITVHHAFLVLDNQGVFDLFSNPVPMQLVQ